MTVLLRSLVVWLMLLAIPWQGSAAASMLPCAAGSARVGLVTSAAHTMPAGHDHAAMLAAAHGTAKHGASHAADASLHGGAKCGLGAACCMAVAPAPAPSSALPVLAMRSEAIPFLPDFLPTVHPDHPERPPHSTGA